MSINEQELEQGRDKESKVISTLCTQVKMLTQLVKRQKKILVINVITLILVILLFLAATAVGYFSVITKQVGLVTLVDVPTLGVTIPDFDPIAVVIPDDDKTAELNDKLEKSKMCINMISSVVFKNAYSSGKLNIINSEANNYPQFVTIVLDSNNATIYESGLIGVGKCIPYDTLDVALPAGTYECTAVFQQVDTDTNSICGKAAAKVQITIQN